MLAFAAREFALMERLDDGSCQRDHITSIVRQTGIYPEGWEPVEAPPETMYLWNHWASMNARRTSSGFGPNPIPDEGVTAWERRRGLVLHRIEHEVLDRLEHLFFFCQPKAKVK